MLENGVQWLSNVTGYLKKTRNRSTAPEGVIERESSTTATLRKLQYHMTEYVKKYVEKLRVVIRLLGTPREN